MARSAGVPGASGALTSTPAAGTRWRCGGCGNLTRFDVTRARRSREYWHFDLAGEPRVEESETLNDDLLEVACRWCGRADAIEVVDRPDGSSSEDHDGAP